MGKDPLFGKEPDKLLPRCVLRDAQEMVRRKLKIQDWWLGGGGREY